MGGRRRLAVLAVALLAVGLAVAACGGSGGHSRRIDAAAWKSLGPQGGVVIGLVSDPRGSRTVYAATYDSVFKSVDGGGHWTVSATGLGEGVVLVAAPSAPHTLYAGDGGAHAAGVALEAPPLVSRSVDGGATWTPAGSGLPAGAAIATLAVDPSDAETVYAGLTTPGVLTSGPYAGIFKTTDGGKRWREVNSGLPSTYDGYPKIDALAIDPRSPRTVYAATRIGGVYESTDGGGSWVVANRGLGSGLSAPMVSGLVVDPATPGAVYASTDKGVFKRAEADGRWTRTALSARAVSLAVDPAGTLYAATEKGLFRSGNAGRSWALTGSRAIGALALDRRRPATLYAATIDGVVKSADGGAHWRTASSGLTATIGQVIAIDSRSSKTTLYLGTAFGGIFWSSDAGRTWRAANTGLGRFLGRRPTVFALTRDPATNRLYASTENGLFVSEKAGATWRRLAVDDDPVYGVRTVVIDPKEPRNLYAASDSGLAASTDGGKTWHAIEQGLGSNDKYGVLALAIDPRSSRTLYVGTSEGSVYKSDDRGADWRPARSGLPCGGDKCSSVWQLVVDPSSKTLYAVTRKGVFKSTDAAASWQSAGKGLPAARAGRVATFSLLIDPGSPSTLYAATAAGVFRSEDGAGSWSPIGSQPRHKGVVALALDPAGPTLYAATAGGVYAAVTE